MEEQSSSEKKCNSVSSGDNFTMAKPSIGVASSSSNSLSLHKQGLENQKPREVDNKLTPLCVEIFAGKASFSRALVQAGFEVLSIDHEVEGPLRPIVSLDLTTKSGQELLWMILKSPRLVAIHLGLPCGTASKARDRPISKELQQLGVPSPAPLRSAAYPLGIPGISGVNATKLAKANELYKLAVEIIRFADERQVVISIENPFSSYLWAALVQLTLKHSLEVMRAYNKLEMVRFHSCCHGSRRKKDTGWLSTPKIFANLNAVCQGDHDHDPWGVTYQMGQWKLDTASEAAYPMLLAQRAAACLVVHAKSKGWSLVSRPKLHDLATASLNKQSKKHKPLIPEYHRVVFQQSNTDIPSGAKIIAPHIGGSGREELDEKLDTNMSGKIKVGHFHTPKQFVSLSRKVNHPMDSTEHLEEPTLFSLKFNLTYPSHLVQIERKKNLLQAKIFMKKLESEEVAMHKSFPDCLRKVLEGKRLLLWRELLRKYQYDDMGVIDFMLKGVPLVGAHDAPSCYPELLKPASMTQSDLEYTAAWRRKAMLARVPVVDPSHIDHLIETTNEELSLGFLEGPFFTEDEVTRHLGRSDWSLVRRFVLVQGAEGKLRPIDDCLEAQLNFAYTSVSYLKLQDVDYVSGLALKIAAAVSKRSSTSGESAWLGKCLDLSKAYKQMGVLPDHRHLAVIFFHDYAGQPRFYVSNSLMFGATAAIYAFNRVSRSLWYLFNRMLLIPCGVFFDDLPMFSPKELALDADQSASELLDLLGWKHARTGPKGRPFESCFNVLGCSLSLERLSFGEVVLENKQGRLERIFLQLTSIKAEDRMSLHQAQVLHGLLRYSRGFFAGKHLQQVCMEILQLGRFKHLQSRGRLHDFCTYAAECLSSCKPRVIRTKGDVRPVLIFTDASWEANVGGIGAVVIDTASNRVVIYSGQIVESLRDAWIQQVGEHLICQLELYAMVCIRWSLKHLLHDRRAIWWVDNEAARFAIIKGQSGSDVMNHLVRAYFSVDGGFPSYGWVERVPSFSNPADAPSRFEPETARGLFDDAELLEFQQPSELLSNLMQSMAGQSRGKKRTS